MSDMNCLVTGAGRGIGREIAERLSADGHRVALAARTAAQVRDVADTLPGPALPLTADVTDVRDVEHMFAAVEKEWGAVDVMVAAAGISGAGPLTETSDDEWQRMLDVNLTAPFKCMRRALPGMEQAGWGRIVVVASMAAKAGGKLIAPYTASKHGVLGLVRSAAAEYAKRGITVNAVCPGYVDTPMTDESVATISARTGRTREQARETLERQQPIRRLIDPGEVADAVLLCINNGGISGQGINVDGGAVQS